MSDEIYIAKEESVQEIKSIIGNPNDTGGSVTAGSVMAKSNLILDRVGINHSIVDVFDRVYKPVMSPAILDTSECFEVFSGTYETSYVNFERYEGRLYMLFGTSPKKILRVYEIEPFNLVEEVEIQGVDFTVSGMMYSKICVNDNYIFVVNLQNVVKINKTNYTVEQSVAGTGNCRLAKCDEKYIYAVVGNDFKRYLISNLASNTVISNLSTGIVKPTSQFCVKDGYIYAFSRESSNTLQKISREDMNSPIVSILAFENSCLEFNEVGNLLCIPRHSLGSKELNPDTLETVREFSFRPTQIINDLGVLSFYQNGKFVIRGEVTPSGQPTVAYVFIFDIEKDTFIISSAQNKAIYPLLFTQGYLYGLIEAKKVVFAMQHQISSYKLVEEG